MIFSRPLAKIATILAAAFSPTLAAGATLVDFTDLPEPAGFVYDLGFTTLTLTSENGAINANTPVDGCSAALLACQNDGLGVGPGDEIGGDERIIATFSNAVDVERILFLDLFLDPSLTEDETAVVEAATSGGSNFTLFFDGANVPYDDGGFLDAATPGLMDIVSLSFSVGDGNDDLGIPDFALAGLSVVERFDAPPPPTPIPLPPAGLMLLGALAGIVVLGARGRAASI